MNKNIIKNPFLIGGVIIVVLAIGTYWYVDSSKAPSFGTTPATRGNIVESVDVSGNVLAENSVDLSFQAGGQISRVYVNEGDTVAAGTTLAALDGGAAAAAVEQANAALAAAQARLDGLQTGTRPEQIAIDQSAITTAKTSLSAAVSSAYTAGDDAVRNQTDILFSNPQTDNPVLLVPTSDSQMQINIQAQRVKLRTSLNAWYTAMTTSNSDPTFLSSTGLTTLQAIQSYLDAVALAVNSVPTGAIPAATLTQYKIAVGTARTEVNASVSALVSAQTALTNAQNTLALAQAGTAPQDINAGKAAVLQAQAGVSTAQVALNNTIIRAPFSGTVRNVTAKQGQVATPGVPVLSLTNSNGLKIETYISEADIAKVKTDSIASATLDAYGTETIFPAKVTNVDSAQTTVNGVSAYKVTLHFTSSDPRPKAGMTANLHILVSEHDNVVEVPSKLIVNDNDKHYVLVVNGNQTDRKEVQVGITSNDGMTEITSGLSAGDNIKTF